MIIGRLVQSLKVLAGPIVAGVTILIFAGSPVEAGFEAEHRGAVQACSESSPSIRQLAMIDHTSDGGFQCIGVFVEDGAVKAIRLERHSFAAAQGGRTEQIKVVEYPPAVVDSPRGAVIDGIPGHDAIVLHGHFAAPPDKGELILSYLYNGLTGEYHSCRIALDRTLGDGSAGGWRLVNRLDQPISLIMVRIRQLPMIGVIGIANLEGACT